MYFCTMCVSCPQTRKEWVSDPQGLKSLQRIVSSPGLWELFLVAPECSAFSPAPYSLRHSCFKRMCGVDWPGTQTPICPSPQCSDEVYRSGNINLADFSRISCRLPHLRP